MSTSEVDPVKLPAKKKLVKGEIIHKLVKQVLINKSNPNAVGALFALFEKESFRIEVFDFKNSFKAVLYINGLTFECEATQKKKARNDVATKALYHLFSDIIQEMQLDLKENLIPIGESKSVMNSAFNELSNAVRSRGIFFNHNISLGNTTLQFVAKCDKLHTSQLENGNVEKKAKNDCMDCNQQHMIAPKRKEIKINILERVVKQALGIEECQNPNTVTALYTLFERDSFFFEIVPVNTSDNFMAHLHINGVIYSESASSIKKAKTNATIKALKELFPDIARLGNPNEIPDDRRLSYSSQELSRHTSDNTTSSLINGEITNGLTGNEACSCNTITLHSFSDFIASLIQSKYSGVVESYEDYLQRYSVLAGIVMIQNNDTSNATIICVCTGNKCLRGDHVSKDGNVLFDCHAEILARRCLILYLYSQLNLSLSSNNETILEVVENGCYRVKENVKFYLYISSAPCGDGRVFNFSPAKNPSRPKLAEKRGILRVKLESGMGGIPVTEYMKLNPTFEDYMKGQQMVLMCCSAKLMRANVLGTQGALLSHFLEPVYFHGILIGDIFHKGNLERALYGRAEHTVLNELPKPFRFNKPFVEGITNSKIVINVKPGKSCMNWVVCEPSVEFIKTKTGQTTNETESRLSKLNLFKRFLDIFGLFKNIELPQASFISYHDYKESSVAYQQAKNTFFQALELNSRGQWIRKSKESDFFCVKPEEKQENKEITDVVSEVP